MIQPGDDLAGLINSSCIQSGVDWLDGDILVLAQKIVSKSEGRLVNLSEVVPSQKAMEYAVTTEKDPRFIELVLRESTEVLRVRFNTIIVEHRCGFICANAGIDHSNVHGLWGNEDDWVLLLPENPDESARKIRDGLQNLTGKRIGVLIIDSHGRAWRMGTVGVAIGVADVPALIDMRGTTDLFGFHLKVTMVAAADELAAAASLIMGQAAEGTPAVHVRGFPYPLRPSELNELIRPKDMDLFR
jgi:coenzyme F420-0:L-glutamate ligase/coenzyme F420-1:gamma-L-glutamate ligase